MKYEAKLIDGKMMFVSRDIKVGDKKIYTPKGIGECIVRRPSPRFKTHDLIVVSFGPGEDDTEAYALNEFEAYKIIGQISSEATWVKEGDEFEHPQDCWISNSEIGQLDTFVIKGPCGHFH